ncbi:MAG TPA: DUF5683 domain-containing protein [Balneolaceae bacterium]|nr:DUF5683 domain-containing protein [Balneolaceae bacterium]
MMSWSGLWIFLIRSLSLFLLLFGLLFSTVDAQSIQYKSTEYYELMLQPNINNVRADTVDYFPDYPNPTTVMFKSMILPGWGQVVNEQIWKVPIIYGLLGGLTYYSIYLTKKYHGYRAAYYNLNDEEPDDFRFGPTPDYISPNTSLRFLKDQRNQFRNQRDLSYVYIALAYGLNVIDAYIFANLKSFDVSEDLSLNATLSPTLVSRSTPGFTLLIEIF